jgi:hypothetical protein
MDEFIRVVKSKAKPMAVGGTLISGALMAGLAAAYVQAVNEGEPVCAGALYCLTLQYDVAPAPPLLSSSHSKLVSMRMRNRCRSVW